MATNSYNHTMARQASYKTPASTPINQWVRDALEHSGMSQSAMARELFARKIISADDRSIVNKMAHGRDISTNEALAIADITGFPILPESHPVVQVPLLSTVSAGALLRDDLSDEALSTISVAELSTGDWIALRVTGDSMDRISPPESVVIINRKDKRLVTNACYVIADHEGNATYKRFRADPMRFEPVSTNPVHEPIFPDHEPVIIGRVKRTMLDM